VQPGEVGAALRGPSGSPRVVVACAGSQEKWRNYTGRPSHLALVDETPLLARTVEQVRRLSGHTAETHITGPGDQRYKIPGTTHHVRTPDEPSEYASTRALWSTTGRTVLLLGDTYFTDDALSVILGCDDRDYRVFGRVGASKTLGTPAGEIFGISWWPAQIPLLDRHLEIVHKTRAAGTVTRPPGWMLLRSWCGIPLGRHRVMRPPFVDLPDDLTDDLDRPADWDRHPVFGGGRAGG
jgi:hypothetical protein